MGKPFEKIASYYDALMHDVDYKGWVDYIWDIFAFLNKKPQIILDLACGTGTPTLLLRKKGVEVIGIDASESMLEIAKTKSLIKGYSIPFFKMDMRKLNLNGKSADAVICLYDSINYILEEDELHNTFKGVYEALNPSGTFIFDINTEYALKELWDNRISIKEVDNVFSIWQNKWDDNEKISTLLLTLFVEKENKVFERIEEIHREKAYPLSTIEALLSNVGFSRIFSFEHRTFNPPRFNTIRVMWVAEKSY